MTPRKTATPEQLDHFFSGVCLLIDQYTDGWGDFKGLERVETIVNDIFEASRIVTPGRFTLDWGKDNNCYWGFTRFMDTVNGVGRE